MKQSYKNIYTGIDDILCYNFDKIIQTGDMFFLYKDASQKKEISESELEQVWEAIYDEFIKEFGISEQYKMYLEKMGLYVQALDAAYNGGDRSQLTFAELRKRQAEDMLKTQENKISVYAIVSKYMGFPCKATELTVKEFYSYLKLAGGKE